MTCSPEFPLCLFLSLRNDGTEFGGSIYQKVNSQLETAVNLAWTAGNSNTRFGIAAKYQIDADAAFSVSGPFLVWSPYGELYHFYAPSQYFNHGIRIAL